MKSSLTRPDYAQQVHFRHEMERCLHDYLQDEDFVWQSLLWALFYQCLPETWHEEVLPAWLTIPQGGSASWTIYLRHAASAYRFHFLSSEVLRRLQPLLWQRARLQDAHQSRWEALARCRLQLKTQHRPELWSQHQVCRGHLKELLHPEALNAEQADRILDDFLKSASSS